MPHCYICKVVKDPEDFTRDSSRSTGVSSKCKACASRIVTERRKDTDYYVKYREKLLKEDKIICSSCHSVRKRHSHYRSKCRSCGQEALEKKEKQLDLFKG